MTLGLHSMTIRRQSILVLSVAMLATAATYVLYDPSVPWSVAQDRVNGTVAASLPHGTVVARRCIEPDYLSVPLTIRVHPRNWKKENSRYADDLPRFANLVIRVPSGSLWVDILAHRTRVSAFAVSGAREVEAPAHTLANSLRTAFPGLPVKVRVSREETQQPDGEATQESARSAAP